MAPLDTLCTREVPASISSIARRDLSALDGIRCVYTSRAPQKGFEQLTDGNEWRAADKHGLPITWLRQSCPDGSTAGSPWTTTGRHRPPPCRRNESRPPRRCRGSAGWEGRRHRRYQARAR